MSNGGTLLDRLYIDVDIDVGKIGLGMMKANDDIAKGSNRLVTTLAKSERYIEKLNKEFMQGKINGSKYQSSLNKLAGALKQVGLTYQQAQKHVMGYAAAQRASNAAVIAGAAAQRTANVAVAGGVAVRAGRGGLGRDRFGRSSGQVNMQRINLGYQVNDVAAGLATGIQDPLTIALQQGSQMLQIYAGQGGLKAALTDVFKILGKGAKLAWPLAVVAAGFKGIQSELNSLTGINATYIETAIAGFQLLAKKIGKSLGPAINWAAKAFKWLFDGIGKGMKWVYNGLANATARGNIRKEVYEEMGLNSRNSPTNKSGRIMNPEAEAEIRKRIKAYEDSNPNPFGDALISLKDQVELNRLNDDEDDGKGKKTKYKVVRKQADELLDIFKTISEESRTAAENFSSAFGNAFEELASTGKVTFASFAADLKNTIIQSTSDIFKNAITNSLLQTGLGQSNLFANLFGGGTTAASVGRGFQINPGFNSVLDGSNITQRGLGNITHPGGDILRGTVGSPYSGQFKFHALGGSSMPWRNFIAGERGAELVSSDGRSSARHIKTASQTANMGSKVVNVHMTVMANNPAEFAGSTGQMKRRLSNIVGGNRLN